MSQSSSTPDPVAWMVLDRNDTPYGTVYDALEAEDKAKIAAIWSAHRAPYRIVPLYDHPSALPDTTPRDPMTTDALCATHGKSIYEHTAEAICRCFGLAPCPACRGDRLTDGSSRCATCGACGVVLSVRDDARVSDARLMSKSWTPELRARLIATYDMRYEDLSADAFEDSDGEMSRREKSERAMSAVLSVFRWWLVSGEVKHWREARAALEPYSGVSPSEGSAPDTPTDHQPWIDERIAEGASLAAAEACVALSGLLDKHFDPQGEEVMELAVLWSEYLRVLKRLPPPSAPDTAPRSYQGAWRWNEDKTARLMSAEDWLEAEARVDEMLDSGKDRGGVLRAIAEEMRQIRTRLTAQAVPPSAPDTKPDETAEIEHRVAILAALKPNWNSYGAPPIAPVALDRARALIAALRHAPDLVPANNGGVTLDWHRDGFEIEISIDEHGVIDDHCACSGVSSSPPEGEDTQRLDWLEGTVDDGGNRDVETTLWSDHEVPEGSAPLFAISGYWAGNHRGENLREAIDSARAAIPPQNTGHE